MHHGRLTPLLRALPHPYTSAPTLFLNWLAYPFHPPPSQVSLGHRNKPQLEEDGRLTWPVLLMYAENMQQDVVEAFGEEDTFAEHLDLVGVG